MTERVSQAIGIACERAKQYKQNPLVLVIDYEKLVFPCVRLNAITYMSPSLNLGAFYPVEFDCADARTTDLWDLLETSVPQQVMRAPESQLAEDVLQYFSLA